MEFPGLVEQAKKFVPELKERGCDLVVVSAHSGADTSSSYGDALPYPENAASLVAQQVPDVDAILVGHAHKEIPQRFETNTATGQQVLLCEPYYWGMRLAVMDFVLEEVHGGAGSAGGSRRPARTCSTPTPSTPTRQVAAAVREQHDTVISYVNSVIGTSTAGDVGGPRGRRGRRRSSTSCNYVQADAVKAGLTGADAALPVLSIAAPFSRSASFPAGEVTVRDVAGLYIYDNTLLGVKVTGARCGRTSSTPRATSGRSPARARSRWPR